MKLCDLDMDYLRYVAVKAARQAGEMIRATKGTSQPVKHKKAGNSRASQLVTETDLKSQEIILSHILPTLEKYDLGLLTEESQDDSSRFEKDHFWCIDPLDGTLPYTESVPGYSVSIALVSKKGESLLGVIYDPLDANTYYALKGRGAFKNDKAWKVQKQPDTFTFITDRSFLNHPQYEQYVELFSLHAKKRGYSEFRIIHTGGAAMNALWIIEHAPAIYFKLPKEEVGGGSVWDFAATSVIVKECGGIATDFGGNPLDLNRKGSTFMNHQGILYSSEKIDFHKLDFL